MDPTLCSWRIPEAAESRETAGGRIAENSLTDCVDAKHRKSVAASRHRRYSPSPPLWNDCLPWNFRERNDWSTTVLCARSVSMSVTNLTQWQRLVLGTEMIQFCFACNPSTHQRCWRWWRHPALGPILARLCCAEWQPVHLIGRQKGRERRAEAVSQWGKAPRTSAVAMNITTLWSTPRMTCLPSFPVTPLKNQRSQPTGFYWTMKKEMALKKNWRLITCWKSCGTWPSS